MTATRPSAVVRSLARMLATAVALVGMLVSAGVALDRVYSGDLLLRLVLGAAVGAVGLSVVARRLPAYAVAPLSIAALAGYALLTTKISAASGGLSGSSVDLATEALRDAFPRLLTALVPVEPQPDTVLVPVLITWLAGLAAAELALRAGRGLAACAVPVAVYAAALVLVGPHASGGTGAAVVAGGRSGDLARAGSVYSVVILVVCAAIVLALSGRWPGRRSGPGDAVRIGPVLVSLAIVATLAVVAGPLVAGRVARTPFDPRGEVTPPRFDLPDENPLTRLSGWALTPDRRLLDVTATGGGGPTRIRLAAMSDYDGVTWRVGASFRPAGRELPAEVPSVEGVTHRAVRQRISVVDLDGLLLPAAATPRRIDGVRVAFDAASGTVVVPEGLRQGLTYTVESVVSTVDVNMLPDLEVPAGPAAARFLALGSAVPSEFTRLAAQLGEGSAAPYHRALAIEQFLGEHYKVVADAPSGHAYPSLAFFLFGERNAGGQRGTSEQFATAFAVLGRILGLPTRVVLGFTAMPDRTAVRASDAFAWPEVLFEGVGWVPFNPLPRTDAAPRAVEEDFKPSPPPSASPPPSVPPPSVSASASASPSGSAPPVARTGAESDRGGYALVGSLALGAGLLGYLATVPALRAALRRRRLRRGDPSRRIGGAWRETLDALRLAGGRVPAHLTATEVAALADGSGAPADSSRSAATTLRPAYPSGMSLADGGRSSLEELARLANAAAFAPGAMAAPAADRAVSIALARTAVLRRACPWWRRIWWSVDPRPLWWHR